MRKSEEIRKLIVVYREKGQTYAQIAEKYKISIGGARKIYEKFKKTGSCATKYGGGRKPKISEHQTWLMKRKMMVKPDTKPRELLEECNLTNVSLRTVRRKLQNMGFKSYFAKKNH